MEERLQKLLAGAGVASRRASEALILAGRVTVNGRPARVLGARADPDRDDVRVDGRPVQRTPPHRYLLLHKPPGYTTTVADPHAARTVMELLPADAGRVFPVGRLDRDSEGLLLLTDDGELTQRLLHPRYHLPREYAVMVRGHRSESILRRLRQGALVEGKKTAPAEVEPSAPPQFLARTTAPVTGGPTTHPTASRAPRAFRHAEPRPRQRGAAEPQTFWLRFVLYEGRKREIRALCAHAELEVLRLVRVRMGPLALDNLRPGTCRRLSAQEIARLRRACGLADSGQQGDGRPRARRRRR